MQPVKETVCNLVREALHEKFASWDAEVTQINKAVTQIKWKTTDRPPRYFTVRVTEHI